MTIPLDDQRQPVSTERQAAGTGDCPEASGIAFRMTRRVQFAETDLAGVLHFSNYYRWMEEVEHAFWRSLGLSVMMAHENRMISWPRVASACEYFAPARFEEELELLFSVAHVGERSVAFEVEFRKGNQRVAAGRTTAVCCATSAGVFQPITIPASIREKLVSVAQSVSDPKG